MFGEAEELLQSISIFRESLHAAAEREQSFWTKQQFALRERMATSNWSPLHWAWATAMVVILTVAIFLARSPNTPHNYVSEDADNALLQQVQGDISREVPQALAPAVLIAEERSEIMAGEVNRQSENIPKKKP